MTAGSGRIEEEEDYHADAGFYLDYGNNDFERGSTKTYDIGNLPKVGIGFVRDIKELTIGKEGGDGDSGAGTEAHPQRGDVHCGELSQ